MNRISEFIHWPKDEKRAAILDEWQRRMVNTDGDGSLDPEKVALCGYISSILFEVKRAGLFRKSDLEKALRFKRNSFEPEVFNQAWQMVYTVATAKQSVVDPLGTEVSFPQPIDATFLRMR